MTHDEDLNEEAVQPEIVPEGEDIPEFAAAPETEEDEHRPLPVLRAETLPARLDPLAAYLREISRHEALSEEEEMRLAVRYRQEGDTAAAYRLITANLRQVVRIAMGFKREWQNLMDLIQEGNVGLMQAVRNFDPFRGVRLPVYAAWWVRAYILRFILDNWRLVKVGTTNARRKLLYNLRAEKEKLEREGFCPTPKLLAERFGVEEQDVIDVEASLGAADVGLDAPAQSGESLTPAQYLTDGSHPGQEAETGQMRRLLREKLAAFAAGAKPVERDILDSRILAEEPQPLHTIGERHGVTREAVRQAEQRLLAKLKTYLLEHMPEVADYFNT